MKIGLLTDALEHIATLDEVVAWCAARELEAVELGVGGYSSSPHAARSELRADRSERERLIGSLARHDIELAALNVSGNPLHPRPEVARQHDLALHEAVQLAAMLDVRRVVAMSGCPGNPGGSGDWPVFAGGAWLPDMEGLWDRQWSQAIAPYWTELSEWAAREAPEVRICLELHPGTSIYNAESFLRLRGVTGPNVCVNLDPSHFWWQGIDPVTTIELVGDRIGFVHGKDTIVHPDRVARHGLLDFRWPTDPNEMPWHFAAVGTSRPASEWADLLAALTAAGYDDVVSIEHEDPRLTPEAGIETSLRGLRDACDQARRQKAGT